MEPEGKLAETVASIKNYSSSGTILLIALLSFYGAEILTGSTSVEGIIQYPVSFLASLAFYGFQVAIIADLSIRFHFRFATIYLIGLAYGILEEGIAIFTMETTSSHTLWLSLYGLNLTWTIYVMILHSVITVLTTFMLVKVIQQEKLEKPILSRASYFVILPVIIPIYYFLMISSISAGRVPAIVPVILLVLLFFLLIITAWINSIKPSQTKKMANHGGYGVSIPFAAGMILPFVIGNRIPTLLIPETLALLLLMVYLFIYFNRLGTINEMDRKYLWVLSSLFLAIMLIGGKFNRTFPSDVVAIFISLILVFIGYLKVKGTR